MSTTTVPRTARNEHSWAWRSLASLVAAAVLITGFAVPANAAEPDPTTIHIQGTLAVVEAETTTGAIGQNTATDTSYVVQTADGTTIPVDGNLIPADATSGATVDAIATPTDATLQEAGNAPPGPVEATSTAGQNIVEASTTVGEPLTLATGTITPKVAAATAVSANHQLEVAVVTDSEGRVSPVTDAFITSMVSKSATYWNDQTGQLPSIYLSSIKRYSTTLDPCAADKWSLWNEAAAKFGRVGYSSYINSTTNHLLVIAPQECGLDSGLANIGAGMSNGGVLWTALGGTTTLPLADELTITHELGHNFSLRHSNVESCTYPASDGASGCGIQEYADLYDPMGMGYLICAPTCKGNTNTPALNVTHRLRLNAYQSVTPVSLPSGSLTETTSVVIYPQSATTGVRGIDITDPKTGAHYYVEYRNATYRDTGSIYSQLPDQGSGVLPKMGTGVRILKYGADQSSVVLPYTTSTTRSAVWPVASTFTSTSGKVKINVVTAAGGTAKIDITLITPVLAKFTGEGLPTIAGNPWVGENLAVNPSTWSPIPSGNSYQWFRDGVAIPGAESRNYIVTAADAGHAITAAITGSKLAYEDRTWTSEPLAIIANPTFAGDNLPTITGVLIVEQTLTANPASWSPSPTSYTYQWLRDGAPISGATTKTFTTQVSDAGKQISVAVTGKRNVFVDRTWTSNPVTIAGIGSIDGTTLPTITGTLRLGQTLTAVPGAGWAPAPTNYSYQWFRDGAPIAGAVGKPYLLQAADVGHALSVSVTGSKSGYTAHTAVSDPTGTIEDLPKVTGTDLPTITGEQRITKTLTATPATTWTPVPTTLTYVWLRDGQPIPGATAVTYTLTADDVTHHISVAVTGTVTGYKATTWTSLEGSEVIGWDKFTGDNLPTITGIRSIGQALTAVPGAGWAPTPTTTKYQWYRDGVAITGAASRNYTLTSADIGTNTSVGITYIRAAYDNREWVSSDTEITTDVPDFTGEDLPTITGTHQLNQLLTAAPGVDWAPTPTAYTYKWLRDGKAIAGATAATYRQVAADVGHVLNIAVTGTRPLVKERTWTSESTLVTTDLTSFAGENLPTITGERRIGKVLTATNGTGWAPTPTTVTVQWFRDGQLIAGATARSFTQTAADVDHVLSVALTAHKVGLPDRTWKSEGDTVTAGPDVFTGDNLPTLSPAPPKTGVTVTAVKGDGWAPSATSYKYQWFLNGQPIAGATKTTYAPTAADAGKKLTVSITASRQFYIDRTWTSVSDSSSMIGQSTFAGEGRPYITGSAKVGQSLTAFPPTGLTPAPSFKYQWQRNGVDIPKATAKVYKLVEDDLGTLIGVKITGTRVGFESRVWIVTIAIKIVGLLEFAGDDLPWFSFEEGDEHREYGIGDPEMGSSTDPNHESGGSWENGVWVGTVDPGGKGFDNPGTIIPGNPSGISIEGSYELAHRIYAKPGKWTPTPTSYKYQWYREGVLIPGSLGKQSSYLPVAADVGHTLTVAITGSRKDYKTKTWMSNPTPVIKPLPPFVGENLPVITGEAVVGGKLVANTPAGVLPTPTKTVFKWFRDGVAITGTNYHTVTAADIGHTFTVEATVSKATYSSRTYTSLPTAVVKAAPPATVKGK